MRPETRKPPQLSQHRKVEVSPYSPPRSLSPGLANRKRPSWLGIASILIAFLGGSTFVGAIAAASLVETRHTGAMEEQSFETFVIGLVVVAALVGNMIGMALGFVGLFIKDQSIVLPSLGILFNGAVAFVIVALMVIGLLVGS